MRKRLLILFSLLAILGGITAISQAQQIITVAVPFFWEMLIDDVVLEAFEAEYGVDVQFVYTPQNQMSLPTKTDEIEDYLTELTDYANSADVLYVSPDILTPEASRAGFFVDLMPLVSADANLDSADFYAAVWDGYTWDNSMWAVPTSASVNLVSYVPEKFDAAGLTYPDANWTLDDYARAARELAEYDANGNATFPGIVIDSTARNLLLRSLLNAGFANDGVLPSAPMITDPQLVQLLETWLELENEGVIAASITDFARFNDVPMRFGLGGFGFVSVEVTVGDDDSNEPNSDPIFDGEEQVVRMLAPLPNNQAGLDVNGFAISSGTTQPELAYDLVRYLTEQQVIANAGGAEPARYSYDTPDSVGNGPVVIFNGGNQRTPEEELLIQDALETGLNTADLRFGYYIEGALQLVRENGLSVDEALLQVQTNALDILVAMDEADVQLDVAIVEPVVLAEGKIALDFGVQLFTDPLPNPDLWDELMAEFIANDPEVGLVNLDSGFIMPENYVSDYDCFYFGVNYAADFGITGLLALDPLVLSDPNYNMNDISINALEAMRVNGLLYGLPMTLTPQILDYNPRAFENAGIAEPLDGWTMSEFIDALQQIQPVLDEGEAAFVSKTFGDTYLLMLIAAQGGLPFDFSTDPVTIDFTAPQTVEAIRAVLDLAKDGYIDYQALAQFGAGRGIFISDGDIPAAIAASSFLGNPEESLLPFMPTTKTTTYPTGTTYNPVAYEVGGGFISADTAYPEACYRWLSFLANHPYVLNAMPALLPTLNQPELALVLGDDTVAAYQRFAQILNSPNAINLSPTDFFVSQWLDAAFDAYVLNDADLLTALQDAEQKTNDYLACAAQIEDDAEFSEFQTCVDNVG